MTVRCSLLVARRIAVDAAPLARSSPTGGDVYARQLIPRLALAAPELEWTFYSPGPAESPGVDVTVLPFPVLRTQLRLPLELRRMRPDLLFSPASGLPLWCPAAALTVVHGLEFKRRPQLYPLRLRAYLEGSVRLAIRHSRRLLTVSESTRRDLVEFYGIDPERVTVVYPGPGNLPESRQVEAAPELPAGVRPPYVLSVGRIEPRKNQLTLLRAVEAIPGLQLVCVGPPADGAMARELRASSRCLLLDWVAPPVRDGLYRSCAAFAFPSLYEGFGLPILEAMGWGAPVITCRHSSLPEAAGVAALYVEDPLDAGALRTAIERLLGDRELRAELVNRGATQVQKFSWMTCATQTANVIRSLLDEAADGDER